MVLVCGFYVCVVRFLCYIYRSSLFFVVLAVLSYVCFVTDCSNKKTLPKVLILFYCLLPLIYFYQKNYQLYAMMEELMSRPAEGADVCCSASSPDTLQENLVSSSNVSFKSQLFVNNE